ncbi:MAG: WD40/YVTN/BNR-like repeat-containing protein [Gemmatimonadales bacterium]
MTFVRAFLPRLKTIVTVAAVAAIAGSPLTAQAPDPVFSAMHWREIGPTRAGRARALAGVPSQPNVFYIGFDNGGLWRSTDYGSNWEPLFDHEPTGSVGAIAVAASNPNVIYVGSGAGIVRPDLSVGDGVYKSTDAGKTWRHLGLRESQMIAMIDVDPKDPNRLFVAVLGHPYGPNAERGVFRSTDGGETFQKVLYVDEYTSANDVRIDPNDPNTVYATLWPQQQAYIEGREFGTTGETGGIFKSTDGGTTWHKLTNGLPVVLEANLGIATSNSKVVYASVASPIAGGGGRGGSGGPGVSLYKTVDGGDHWHLANYDASAPNTPRPQDPRPMARIGGGDLPTLAVDPKNSNVVYSASTVFWRTEDGGLTWSAVRGAPGGDDYQRPWVSPANSDIILLVSDQGAVVSANRGKSWSQWYNQNTAAMYHVSTDFSFPYRVCGGQQDSGSACVDSRSNDGEITFHDWHPVNIQEYGEAAPDPKNPDRVFGSSRSGVSLFDRVTGQTTNVGPDLTGYNRNVRTMPIEWSPTDWKTMFYANDAVFKTSDGGHSWTRISGDLARQTWEVPANTGKYASTVTPGPQGSITALSPSPRDIKVLWAGTDDGTIQVTMDGGAKWTNVTPSSVKPWARVFNIEAGHFDTQTAYAAVNTLRLDDMNPHFLRTHDGGKTWTEINTGVAPGAVVNSIREDPRKKGLLYGASDTQVWVSFDDGDHWESLRLNMPAITVRDIEVKDDSTCMCADLVAGTHGRGFWILDDVTPLRQYAEAKAATAAYLYKPETAVRVRWGTNDPTPWPPEVAAGENPLPGAMIDYYLAANADGTVKLEILGAGGKVMRSYTSDEPVRNPDPAVDPEAYNKICQRTPNAADCGLPLYWPAPQMRIETTAGMHRFSWDMHYDPIGAGGGRGGSMGAVPHRTYPAVSSPWAAPGTYTVRLTVGGKSYTQPIALKMDPRIKTPAIALAQLTSLTTEMYDGAKNARAAYERARALIAELDKAQGADAQKLKTEVEAIAPPPPVGGGGRGGRGGGRGGAAAQAGPATLESASNAMNAAAMAMQAADIAPTANQVAACTKAKGEGSEVLAKWRSLSTLQLAALNAKLKASGQPAVKLPE